MVIERCHKDDISVKKIYDEVVREKKFPFMISLTCSIQIRKLQSFYNAHKNEVNLIAPTYQWAEGLEEVITIYLNDDI